MREGLPPNNAARQLTLLSNKNGRALSPIRLFRVRARQLAVEGWGSPLDQALSDDQSDHHSVGDVDEEG